MTIHIKCTVGSVRQLLRPAGITLAASLIFAAVPVTIDQSGIHRADALAGKGNGRDNGNSGGRGGARGNSVGHSNAGNAAGSSNNANGTKTKLPGSLNAVNAAPSAFKHANRKSRTGALADYMDAMRDYAAAVEAGDAAAQEAALDAAADALAAATNKDFAIDAGVVDAVNEALDGKAEGFQHTGEPGDPIHEAEQAVADRINPPPL